MSHKKHLTGPKSELRANLSPEEALAEIAAGKSAANIFARLDLSRCQLRDEVDTTGYGGPAIPMEGFGGVAKGKLAMTPEAVAACEADKVPYVTVFRGPNYPQAKRPLEASQVMIMGRSVGADLQFSAGDHFAIGAATNNMTWLRNDSLVHHYAADASDTNSIQVGGITLREGDNVTLDARNGKLYPADLPIKKVPEATRSLDAAVREKMPSGFHVMASAKDHVSVSNAVSSTAEGIGLLRTEDAVRRVLVVLGNNYNTDDEEDEDILMAIMGCNLSGKVYSKPKMQEAFECLLQSSEGSDRLKVGLARGITKYVENDLRRSFYFANKDQGSRHKQYTMTYRFADLGSFVPELADPNILTFENRKHFYEIQINAMFSAIGNPLLGDAGKPDPYDINFDLRILIPYVHNAQELAEIKELVDKAARKHGFIDGEGRRHFKFGAKIESKEAVEPRMAAKIAKLCDFVDFDTNDLTKDVTGLKRDDLDPAAKIAAREWMEKMRREQRGYEGLGDSPFDVLVPEVTRKMAAATAAIRRANPTVDLGCCGRQVAGNPESIKAVVKMGLDNISVPPQDVAASRIIAAHYGALKVLSKPSVTSK